ncbi:MAG TPA: hypothetical protein VIY27_01930, partial [Myxococcota bacterium]
RSAPMRLARLAPLLLLFSGLAAFAAAGEEAPSAPTKQDAGLPTWYAQALAHGDAGLNVTDYWSKGPMLRAETVIAGHKVVTIVKGEWYYVFDGLSRRGLAIRRHADAVAEDARGRRPFGNEYEVLLEQGAEKVGEEILWGRPAEVYRITDQLGRRELWVSQGDEKIPLRLEIFDRKSGKKAYTEYVIWDAAISIPDGFFDPDPSVEFERLEFEAYLQRSAEGKLSGAAPVLFSHLLHVRKRD